MFDSSQCKVFIPHGEEDEWEMLWGVSPHILLGTRNRKVYDFLSNGDHVEDIDLYCWYGNMLGIKFFLDGGDETVYFMPEDLDTLRVHLSVFKEDSNEI